MFMILRKLGNTWGVAVQDVEPQRLNRVLSMWRARGYQVMPVKQPE